MARKFEGGANQVVKADSAKSQTPAKKAIEGNDLRTKGKK